MKISESVRSTTYVFDIDGTICTVTNGKYDEAKPFKDRIEKINQLYNEGNIIIYFTARGMATFRNDSQLAKEKWEVLTRKQLDEWGAKHHKLLLGKPAADLYVDDKGISDKAFFRNRNFLKGIHRILHLP
jgi:hypothetical protein